MSYESNSERNGGHFERQVPVPTVTHSPKKAHLHGRGKGGSHSSKSADFRRDPPTPSEPPLPPPWGVSTTKHGHNWHDGHAKPVGYGLLQQEDPRQQKQQST